MWINITPHSSCYKERIHLILCPFPLDFDRFGMEISGLMMTMITQITKKHKHDKNKVDYKENNNKTHVNKDHNINIYFCSSSFYNL